VEGFTIVRIPKAPAKTTRTVKAIRMVASSRFTQRAKWLKYGSEYSSCQIENTDGKL
jgi:hypothetical protein